MDAWRARVLCFTALFTLLIHAFGRVRKSPACVDRATMGMPRNSGVFSFLPDVSTCQPSHESWTHRNSVLFSRVEGYAGAKDGGPGRWGCSHIALGG